MKSKILKRAIICVAVAALCAASAVFASSCGVDGTVYKIPESKLPTEEKFALKKYDYENLSDVQATVRADTMNVTKRNLPRAQVEMLSDDFSLVYDSAANSIDPVYGSLVATGGDKKTATIKFRQYPSPKQACDGTYLKDNKGQPLKYEDGSIKYAFSNGTMNGVSVDNSDGAFYKYMLMTQGQHLAMDAQKLSAETASNEDGINPEFAAWLKKHPSADAQYGAVLGENNAVEKEITLDPLYRSYHASGLYLPAGEPVAVKVEGLRAGEKISVIIGVQNSLAWRGGADNAQYQAIVGGKDTPVKSNSVDAYFTKADVLVANGKMTAGKVTNQSQWSRQNARAPWVTAEFTFTENKTYTIGTPFGGCIHIGMNNCYSRVKTTFTGAVETPHYILGVTTPQYFDQYLRQAPGVIAVLDTENGQLIGYTGEMGTSQYMRKVKTEEIDKLAMLWHSFLSVNESFTGGTYNRFNKIMFDWHVPAGAAVALGNYSFAQPTGWFDGAMNYRGLLQSGTWGTLHEIGHNHSASYGTVWGFATGREGEVRNNALTLLAYIMFCDVGTTIRNGGGAEHGMYANPYNVLTETLTFKGKEGDFDDGSYGYFQCLGMYANIMHSFGAEKFYELLYTYKGKPSYVETGTKGNKRSDFAYRCSLVYGMNFINYFNEFYCANITDDMFTAEQLSEMQALPNYVPVSSYYAGGIDGVKTAGDYIVAYGSDIAFDLTEKTISGLDTNESKGFEVISVSQPEHGKIREENGKWYYSFKKDYTGTFDEFSFDVRLADGVIHTLTVTLRITYNGARVGTYTVENPNASGQAMIENLEAQIANLTPEYSNSTFAGVPSFSSADWQVRVADFWWKAPKSGNVELAVSGNNGLCLYFGTDFQSLERTNLIYTGGAKYNHTATFTVEEGTYYAVRVLNTNRGGNGGATVGIKDENGKISAIPAEQVFHVDYPLGKEASSFVYEPQFIVSKKDNIKLSVTGTDKSEWEVVKAPDNIVGDRFYTEQQVDLETGKPIEGSVVEYDRWQFLIDGQAGTVLHTTYGNGVPKITPENPHEFIVDTSKEQLFNYFSVTTRNNSNSYITDCELQISDSLDGEWRTVATADRDSYKSTTITMSFPEESGRYLKLIVKGTTGGNFSVLAEIDAGIKSVTQQVLPSTSSKFFATSGWKNSSAIESEPHGYMISESKNEKLVIKFVGESISLYAATGEGYGTADVYVDGKKASTIDMHSSAPESRKLVFNKENLENKEHTVEIITTSADKVMLNVVGVPYTANLINAANIYKENALTIALVVFLLLFLAAVAFVVCLVALPKFRKAVFGNRFIEKLDNREKKPKKQKAEKAVKNDNQNEEQTKTAAKQADKAPAKKAAKTQKETKDASAKAKPAAKTEKTNKKK
ncbi:MAG: M60 family metallopeptidase [Clostridia bacterium]|nr:M60 family metallopeptidase [Clostridia bacterium]